jgi:hypothetical protein
MRRASPGRMAPWYWTNTAARTTGVRKGRVASISQSGTGTTFLSSRDPGKPLGTDSTVSRPCQTAAGNFSFFAPHLKTRRTRPTRWLTRGRTQPRPTMCFCSSSRCSEVNSAAGRAAYSSSSGRSDSAKDRTSPLGVPSASTRVSAASARKSLARSATR